MMQKLKTCTKIFLLLFLMVSFSCNKRVNNEISPGERIGISQFGLDSTFEIATWNIEQFPKHEQTINDAVEIIEDLDIDLFAVQEITNVNAFQNLIVELEDYDGIVETGTSSNALWTGIIYRKTMITISNGKVLFPDSNYYFPRLPYHAYVQATHDSKIFDFTLVVIHLKAFGDDTSIQRRKEAIQKLEKYIGDKLQQIGDPDYIVAGDWNDELDDTPARNVFTPFLNKPQQYVFLTLPFAGSQNEYSFIGGSFESLIDHIMVTASIDSAYNIETEVIKIDQSFNQYLSEVSDHRPVAARIHAF